MRDPGLPVEHFQRDEVLSRESLFGSDGLACLDNACREGDSVRFSSPRRLTVDLHPVPRDLSRYDRLVVCALNRTASTLLAGMRLIHGSDDPESGSSVISLSGGRETLPPGRWVELNFPRECLGTYGKPTGWTDIRAIELSFGRDKDAPDEGPVDVLVKYVDGEARKVPPGPRLTREGLAHLLNREMSDPTFVGRGRAPGRSILSDLYSVKNSALSIPSPHPYPKENGKAILKGRIMGQALPKTIPWDANPLGRQEWTHFLHRHHFVRELVKAFADSGDARYARAVDRIILSWIEDNPAPVDSNGGAGPAWETLSVAWRLREWLWVIGIAWESAAFRRATRLVMLRSIWEHGRSLMDHQGHPNNWIVVESAALVLAGICFPQFRESEQWRETGLERLGRESHRQFFGDGVHFELSPLYHAICLHAFLEVKEAASIRGFPLPKGFGALLERGADYLAALYRPDFSWPSLNDSGSTDSDFTALMQKAGELCRRPDFTWIATRGRAGTVPDKRSSVFLDAGIAVMRSHHGADANMLVFRAGPAGFAHIHGDVLSLDVTALGVPRLADPGITTYAPDALTDYYRSPAAHSMILIDGKGQERTGLQLSDRSAPAAGQFSFVRRPELELVSGLCRGPWPNGGEDPAVLRTAIFVKGEYWIVRDVIDGPTTREVAALWQFLPGRVQLDIRTLVASCVDARGPSLELIPLQGSADCFVEQCTGMIHPPEGWFSLGGTDLPGTTLRYHLVGTFPLVAVWILLPFRGGLLSGVQATRADRLAETVSLEIRFPERHTDLVSLKRPTKEDLQAGGDRLHGTVKFRRTRSNGQ